jgi:hypothetical protein
MTLSRFNIECIFILSLTAAEEKTPKKWAPAPTLQLYDPGKMFLRRKVESLQQVLQDFKVSAIYRHKNVQYLLVRFSEDQLDDIYVTLPSLCMINS